MYIIKNIPVKILKIYFKIFELDNFIKYLLDTNILKNIVK